MVLKGARGTGGSENVLKKIYYSGGRFSKPGYEKKGKNRLKGLGLILILLFIVFIIAYGVYKLFLIPIPLIEGAEAFKLLPLDKTVVLKGKNLKSIEIFINQGGKRVELLKDLPETIDKTFTLQVKPKELELADGSATVIIKVRSGILRDIKYEINATVDTVPPNIEVLKASYIIQQGSGGFALLRARDADSVFIKLKEHTFRAYKTTSETDLEPSLNLKSTVARYYVFFPAPFDIKDDVVFYAVATDAAGNQNVKALPTRFKTKKFRTSSINISDSFINTVIFSLLNITDTSDPAGAFKKVNEEWRESNLKKLAEVSLETAPEILWKDRFLQLKNSEVTAIYGDRRTYLYKGKITSKSSHLGYDLASVKNSKVIAANSGLVRFAEDLGIYGKTVIIDHGLGLMSLYGHLSNIMVEKGQSVEKGEVIARTGSTGLAGGDHLHFGILIHGYEVSPLHWWDPHWVKVNVTDLLEQ